MARLFALAARSANGLVPGGVIDIQTTAQAARAYARSPGPFAETIFAVGVVGTGLLSVPVLVGGVCCGRGEKAARAPAYGSQSILCVICVASVVGIITNFMRWIRQGAVLERRNQRDRCRTGGGGKT